MMGTMVCSFEYFSGPSNFTHCGQILEEPSDC